MALNTMRTPFTTANFIENAAIRRDARTSANTHQRAGTWTWPLPANSVLAVFDDRAAALDAVGALGEQQAGTTWMASGEDGAQRLRKSFAQRGTLAGLRMRLDGEDETAAQIARRCDAGATVVLLRPAQGQMLDVMQALAERGARLQRRTGRWTWEWKAGHA